MNNPVPDTVRPGDHVTVTVTGRLRTSVDGALTIQTSDILEPVVRVPWTVVETVTASPSAAPNADAWSAVRPVGRL